jgi:hypothetical protein
MRGLLPLIPFAALAANCAMAADPPAPPARITPGKVVIPTDRMRRPWGELVSIDLATRTGTFRNESNDEVMPFTVMPYAELLHHTARGDLQDFRIGERAIFRLHENEEGKWVWLTYIQDEMNFQNGHKEYYWVDAIDPLARTITFTQANADKSFVRQTGLVLETDANTRYWKRSMPASFADIKLGDKLLAKTHGVGKGKSRICWEIFLDDESRNVFQAEQQAIHTQRMEAEGLPGYVDAAEGTALRLSLFPEGAEQAKTLRPGRRVLVAPAGADRRPAAKTTLGVVRAISPVRGNVHEVAVMMDAGTAGFKPTGVARLWPDRSK